MPGNARIVNEQFDDRVGPRWVRLVHGYGDMDLAPGRLRLSVRPGPARPYSLSQLDDYHSISRRVDYPWKAPLRLTVEARFSVNEGMIGTAGFGFWNAPFTGERLAGGGMLPPQVTWFFYASPPNRLAFTSGWPGHGFFVQSVRSPKVPKSAALLGTMAMRTPLLGRLLSRVATGIVPAGEHPIDLDRTAWHTYTLEWKREGTRFAVDDREVYTSTVAPAPPLGFVAWIDNQYASLGTGTKLNAGLLPIPNEQWLDLRHVRIEV